MWNSLDEKRMWKRGYSDTEGRLTDELSCARTTSFCFDFNPETGGILVCCEHGVIIHNGSEGEYWVPYDKYKVSASASRDAILPIASELQKVRNMILSGEYNPKEQKRISFSKYVDKEMDSTSPVKGTKGCGCKRGCNKSCG